MQETWFQPKFNRIWPKPPFGSVKLTLIVFLVSRVGFGLTLKCFGLVWNFFGLYSVDTFWYLIKVNELKLFKLLKNYLHELKLFKFWRFGNFILKKITVLMFDFLKRCMISWFGSANLILAQFHSNHFSHRVELTLFSFRCKLNWDWIYIKIFGL